MATVVSVLAINQNCADSNPTLEILVHLVSG